MHLLVVGSLLWGGARVVPRPDKNAAGAGASALTSNAQPGPTMILINLSAPLDAPAEADLIEELASAGVAPKDLMIEIASSNPLPAIPLTRDDTQQDQDAKTAEAIGNDAQRSLLLGMYMGQIKARIDRAWLRPRNPLKSDAFSCQVQIVQNSSGAVTEVALRRCNGDIRWQESLVAAIQSASPLPAPPDPSLFADQLMLGFEAAPYRLGAADQGYEPAALALRQ
jgi:hypothetical protein